MDINKNASPNQYNRTEGAGSRLSSSRWMQYGVVSAKLKMAKDAGIVTTFVVCILLTFLSAFFFWW